MQIQHEKVNKTQKLDTFLDAFETNDLFFYTNLHLWILNSFTNIPTLYRSEVHKQLN